jgi:hypothetical protein
MLTVSAANCIRFRPVDGLVSNFDNTFDLGNTANNKLISALFQQRYPSGQIKIQAMSAHSETVECRAWYEGAFVAVAAVGAVVNIGAYDYTEFTLDFDATFVSGMVEFELFTDTELWRSEPVMCDETDEDYVILEWFNEEMAFTMNYSTDIVPKMHLKANFNMTAPTGDATVYDNQGNETKLKELVQRVFTLDAVVPAYIADQLVIALAHDHFFINDVEFVCNKKPSPTRSGNSNLYELTVDLDQRIAVGLNTHDRGFDVDAITDAIMTEDGLYFIATNNNEYFEQ